jgi:hypothetical protein
MFMENQILQITFKLEGTRDKSAVENLPLSYAQRIADVPGLQWKIWIINEGHGEAGGIYLFEDAASAQGYLDGPYMAEMKSDPSLSIKTFDVLEDLTATTRGPISPPAV